jgi:hypothetical protein
VSRAPDQARERLLRVLGALGLLLVLVVAYRADLLDPVKMRDFILSFGVLAPVIWALSTWWRCSFPTRRRS